MHPETQYILDCAIEFGEVTPLEYTCVALATDCHRIVDTHLAHDRMPDHFLRNTARDFLERCTVEQRHVLALRAIECARFSLKAFSERVGFMVKRKVQFDLGHSERDNIAFMLEAENVFDHQVFQTVHDVNPVQIRNWVNAQYEGWFHLWEADLEAMQNAMAWAHTVPVSQVEAVAATVFKAWDAKRDIRTVRELISPDYARRVSELNKEQQRKARSAIKKAFKLFQRTGKEENVKLLVSGHEATLSHPDSPFKFVLKPHETGWLEKKTVTTSAHAPFQLYLLTKDDVFIARLCVYFEKTPVLDQLLALTLFVEAGDEDILLRKANWYGFEDVEKTRTLVSQLRPTLVERLPKPHKEGERADILSIVDPRLLQEDVLWEPFKGPVESWIAEWLQPLQTPLQVLAARPSQPQLAMAA